MPLALRHECPPREWLLDGRTVHDACRRGSPSPEGMKRDSRAERSWFADLDLALRKTTEFPQWVRNHRTNTTRGRAPRAPVASVNRNRAAPAGLRRWPESARNGPQNRTAIRETDTPGSRHGPIPGL